MQFDILDKIVRRFRLPVADYSDAPLVIVPAQVGDANSRCFEITLFDDNGDVNLSSYSKAILAAETPAGLVLTSEECVISEDGKYIIAQFSGGLTAQAGRLSCDITVINDEKTKSLTSRTFYVIVSESQLNKLITENVEDYNILLKLLREVTELETSMSKAEPERVKAENARVNAEAVRVAAEDKRRENFNEIVATNAAIKDDLNNLSKKLTTVDDEEIDNIGQARVTLTSEGWKFSNLKGVQGQNGNKIYYFDSSLALPTLGTEVINKILKGTEETTVLTKSVIGDFIISSNNVFGEVTKIDDEYVYVKSLLSIKGEDGGLTIPVLNIEDGHLFVEYENEEGWECVLEYPKLEGQDDFEYNFDNTGGIAYEWKARFSTQSNMSDGQIYELLFRTGSKSEQYYTFDYYFDGGYDINDFGTYRDLCRIHVSNSGIFLHFETSVKDKEARGLQVYGFTLLRKKVKVEEL